MAINKNFVVKNGFEVATNLVYADSDLYNVGIGSTIPRTLLDVRGGIAVTDFSSSGISTFLGEVNIGLDGQYVTFLNSKSGFGTDNPHYLVHINSPVSTGQTALYVRGDMVVTGDINLDDLTLDTLSSNDVTTGTLTGTIATITTLDGDLADFVNISANTGIVTTIRGTNLSYSGIGTITNIDNVNLDVSGIATIATLNASSVTVTGVNVATGSIGNLYSTNSYINVGIVTTLRGNNLSYSGIGTIATLDGTTADFNTIYANVGIVTTLRGTNLNYSGIGTIGTLDGTTADFTNLYANVGVVTNLKGNNFSYSGIGTIGTLDGTTADFTNLYANVGVVTTLRGTNLNYSGIGTINTLSGSIIILSTSASIPSIYSTNLYSNVGVVTTLTSTNLGVTNLNISGIATIGSIPKLNTQSLSVSGVATIGNVQIETGSISATSGILTYYGDGSKLSNVIGGVGIATTGGIVGYGATILDFRGSGISTITVGSGIGTIDLGDSSASTEIERDIFNIVDPSETFTTTSNFDIGYIDVYLNGVKLSSQDYDVLSQNSLRLLSTSIIGDIVEIVNYKRVSISISQLVGNPSINVTNINASGIITATTFDFGGSSSEFLKGDGSLDSNSYTTTGKSIAMAMVFS